MEPALLGGFLVLEEMSRPCSQRIVVVWFDLAGGSPNWHEELLPLNLAWNSPQVDRQLPGPGSGVVVSIFHKHLKANVLATAVGARDNR